VAKAVKEEMEGVAELGAAGGGNVGGEELVRGEGVKRGTLATWK